MLLLVLLIGCTTPVYVTPKSGDFGANFDIRGYEEITTTASDGVTTATVIARGKAPYFGDRTLKSTFTTVRAPDGTTTSTATSQYGTDHVQAKGFWSNFFSGLFGLFVGKTI